MPAILENLLWFGILAFGAFNCFRLLSKARRLPHPLAQARQAAKAFGVAGSLLWLLLMLEEVKTTLSWDLGSVVGLLINGVAWGLFVLVPFWTPYRLLRRDRLSSMGRGIIWFITMAVSAFAILCLCLAPFLFFVSAPGQFLAGIVAIGVPIAVLVLIAATLRKVVKRLDQ